MKMTNGNGAGFLTAKNAENNTLIKMLDEGVWKDSTKYKYDDGTAQKECIFSVEYKKEKKCLRVNKASRVALMEAWGDESKSWIGKEAWIRIMPTPKGDYKMIVLDPIKSSTKTNDLGWAE